MSPTHVPASDASGEFVRSPSGAMVPAHIDPFHQQLRQMHPASLLGDTSQTQGMRRVEAISGKTVGSRGLWMGQTHVAADTRSANHHHGESETAIYVVSGHPAFVFLEVDGEHPVERRLECSPGDYVFVPPWVPHREENCDSREEAVVVIARTTQDAIVVNLDHLSWTAGVIDTVQA